MSLQMGCYTITIDPEQLFAAQDSAMTVLFYLDAEFKNSQKKHQCHGRCNSGCTYIFLLRLY